MRAVVLAGGSGTRLYPVTRYINKHLLPVYSKPMIYYPISIAMLMQIRDLIFVINPQDFGYFDGLFQHLKTLGMNVSWVFQDEPRGLAHGLRVAGDLIGEEPVLYLLGDNILYGHEIIQILTEARQSVEKDGCAYVFGYYVKDPERFGIIEFDESGKVVSIEEKPTHPKSHYAVIGVYMFDNRAVRFAKRIKPSHRGELEITSVLEEYLKEDMLRVKLLGRGFAWFDAGTHDSFLEAGHFVSTIENKTGLMIGCIEEIAYRNGWISGEDLLKIAEPLKKTEYGKYLIRIGEERVEEVKR